MHGRRVGALWLSLAIVFLLDGRIFAFGDIEELPSGGVRNSNKNSSRLSDDEELKKILPLVTFECRTKTGYFADYDFNCEVFHYCEPDGSRKTFLCPQNYFFDSKSMVCEETSDAKGHPCLRTKENLKVNEHNIEKERLNKDSKISAFKAIRKPVGKYQWEKILEKPGYAINEKEHRHPINNATSGKDFLKELMALEDLLAFMNSDQRKDNTNNKREPTFISTFKIRGEDSFKALVNTSFIQPSRELKRTPFTIGDENIRQVQDESSEMEILEKGTSAEDQNRGPNLPKRRRLRKRKSRVLDLKSSPSEPKKSFHHSHVSVRSAASHSDPDDHLNLRLEKELRDWGNEQMTRHNTTNPRPLRLFSIGATRNGTNTYRKRKRYFRRRKKPKNLEDLPQVEEEGSDSHDVIKSGDDRQQWRVATKKRGERTGWHKASGSIDVSSPTPEPESVIHSERTAEAAVTEKISEGNSKNYDNGDQTTDKERNTDKTNQNPWFKKQSNPEEERYVKFGERTTSGYLPEPYYGDENGSPRDENYHEISENYGEKPKSNDPEADLIISPENFKIKHENLRERNKASSNIRSGTGKTEVMPKVKVGEEHRQVTWKPHANENRAQKEYHQIQVDHFPPPRSTTTKRPRKIPVRGFNDWLPLTVPTTMASIQSTNESVETEDGGKEHDDLSTYDKRGKISVGSSYSPFRETTKPIFHLPPSPTRHPMRPPALHIQPLPSFLRQIGKSQGGKVLPKQIVAHQHLSKMMSNFLSMSTNHPGMGPHGRNPALVPRPTSTFENFVPKYRIPYEDIYESESVAKEVSKIPPEVINVMEMISQKSRNKPKEIKKMSKNDFQQLDPTLRDLLRSDIMKILTEDSTENVRKKQERPETSGSKMAIIDDVNDNEEDEIKEIAKIAKFTSLRLGSLLSSVLEDTSDDKPPKQDSQMNKPASGSAIITARKVPIRLIYSESRMKLDSANPKTKAFNTGQHRNIFQASHGRNSYLHPAAQSAPSIVLYPANMHPPHPPPLPTRNAFPRNFPYRHFGMKPMMHHHHHPPFIPRRRKRSPQMRLQPRQFNRNYNRFPSNIFPFASRYMSPYQNFRNMFTPSRQYPSYYGGAFRFPPTYPTTPMAAVFPKPPRYRRPLFLPQQQIRNVQQPAHQQQMRNVHQPSTHQTVIVEEVPIPIPVAVPDIQPQHIKPIRNVVSESFQSPQSYTGLQTYRRPPPQYRSPYPVPHFLEFTTNLPIRPSSSTNHRPPPPPSSIAIPIHQSSSPIREIPVAFSVPGNERPQIILPEKQTREINRTRESRRPSSGSTYKPEYAVTTKQGFKIPEFAHVDSYPNFPYFQGGFTNHLPDLDTLSGLGELPKHFHAGSMQTARPPNTRPAESQGLRPAISDPQQTRYLERIPSQGAHRDSGVTDTAGGLFIVSPPDSTALPHHPSHKNHDPHNAFLVNPNWSVESTESNENGIAKSVVTVRRPTGDRKNRRRRPGSRRKRPRPQNPQGIGNYTGQSNKTETEQINEPSRIPSIPPPPPPKPPQQIPPPPSEFSIEPFPSSLQSGDFQNAIHQISLKPIPNVDIKLSGEPNSFPQAGYYGSEQLSQLLKSSPTLPDMQFQNQRVTDSTEHKMNEEEETSSSTEEDPALFEEGRFGDGKVPFGTRLTGKNRSRGNTRQNLAEEGQVPNGNANIRGDQSATQRKRRLPVQSGVVYEGTRERRLLLRQPGHPTRRRKPTAARTQIAGRGQQQQHHDVKNIQPEVIYYDTREHPMAIFKIADNYPVTHLPTSMTNGPRNRDIFPVPNPYSDRDLFSLQQHPARPQHGSEFYSTAGRQPKSQEEPRNAPQRRPTLQPQFKTEYIQSSTPELIPSPRHPEASQQPARSRARKRTTKAPESVEEKQQHNWKPTTITTPQPKTQSTYGTYYRSTKTSENQQSHFTDQSTRDVPSSKWTEKVTTATPFTTPTEPPIKRPSISDGKDNHQISTKKNETGGQESGSVLSPDPPKVFKAGGISFQKVNASISTSISVSSSVGNNNTNVTPENQPKRVFSSKNGGLAVVRKGPRQRKRVRTQKTTTTATPTAWDPAFKGNGLNENEKFQIAASILDIIKATSETERIQSSLTTPQSTTQREKASSGIARVTKSWLLPPPLNNTESSRSR